MVQIAAFTLAVLASAGLVAADSCNAGGIYCGSAMLMIPLGDYVTKIITNLRASNEPTDDPHIQQGLWTCIEHGDISFKEYCTLGCVGGDKKDDYCKGSSEQVAADAEDAEELAAEGRKFRPRRAAPLDASN
ncbi:putative Killer toxin Kp4 domain-containing protein [Seiridium cardinale]|uniref:Killer toxin Kp4 domain-containing protein n=1 Tax=Seiridium cardinale TaxID=138064 RepID=A0ABR2XQQ5_9PEZI